MADVKGRRVSSSGMIGRFLLTEKSIYLLDGCVHQMAYNKLTGLSRSQLMNKTYSVMIGWRWNPISEKFDLCAHYHWRGCGGKFKQYYLTSVEVSEWFDVEIGQSGDHWFVRTNDIEKFIKKSDPDENFERFWIIPPWFGGRSPAPKDIEYKYVIIRK